MSPNPQWSHHEDALPEGTTITSSALDDAEKGIYDNTPTLPIIPPAAYIDEKKALESHSTADATVAPPPAPAKKAPKPKPSRWILFQLWFNTYRKFFVFVTLLNLTGIILAALGRFPYAENHLGALVLGNLLCAVLFRNELFLRFLYIISIYGLRSVCFPVLFVCRRWLTLSLVGTGLHQAGRDIDSAACRRHPLRLCSFWRRVSNHNCSIPESRTDSIN
jgi:hypothetical protein